MLPKYVRSIIIAEFLCDPPHYASADDLKALDTYTVQLALQMPEFHRVHAAFLWEQHFEHSAISDLPLKGQLQSKMIKLKLLQLNAAIILTLMSYFDRFSQYTNDCIVVTMTFRLKYA